LASLAGVPGVLLGHQSLKDLKMNTPIYPQQRQEKDVCLDNMCDEGGNSAGFAIGAVVAVVVAVVIALWYASGLNHSHSAMTTMPQTSDVNTQPYPDHTIVPPGKSVQVNLK
jgi:hypothetical protein